MINLKPISSHIDQYLIRFPTSIKLLKSIGGITDLRRFKVVTFITIYAQDELLLAKLSATRIELTV